MKKTIHRESHKKGISLVIALIMTTLLLSISLSIGNIILRQIRLTNTGTNSQTSFYAADSALECALYWDTHTDGTVEGSPESAIFGTSTDTGSRIKCGTSVANPLSFIKTIDPITEIATTTFDIDYGNKICGRVQVVKTSNRTKISTSGYNTNALSNGCNLTNAIIDRVVERGLVLTH
jgi:Tfp pilus assembly protein PilX